MFFDYLFFFFIIIIQLLKDDVRDNKTHKEIIANIRELSQKTNIADNEVIGLIWTTVMSWAEWNKKEELVTDQALKHLKQYTQLFSAFATTEKAELSLILRVQEFCYENMNFMKAFQKIIMLFYQGEFVSINFCFCSIHFSNKKKRQRKCKVV